MDSEAQASLNGFWPKVAEDVRSLSQNDMRQQELPLARIKRIMKLDDEVKMISSEAPALFSKAAEIFITELALRAWVHTEDNKRRTLQRNDIAMAITKYDQFDFLIDIVPREEVKPNRVKEEPRAGGLPTDQHYLQLAQHYQTMLQGSNSPGTQQPTIQIVHAPQTQQVQNTTTATQQTATQQQQQQAGTQQQHQVIQLQAASGQQQQQQQNAAPASGGVQIIQQIMGADGQIQSIPIQLTAQHLQMIRMQMASGGAQQPIIIQTPQQPAQQQQQQQQQPQQQQIILQSGAGGQPVYITQQQPQQ